MTDVQSPQIWSDRSDQSDPFGILALFRSDVVPSKSDQSDQLAAAISAGPTGPTASDASTTEKMTRKQCGPTGPTGPTEFKRQFIAAAPTHSDALDLFDRYEERPAIRVNDGGQLSAEAEAAALAEAASVVGLTTNIHRKVWAEHPDAKAYLAYLSATGPTTCVDAACNLNWNRTRAWQAEARLRASGLVTLDIYGHAEVRKAEYPR